MRRERNDQRGRALVVAVLLASMVSACGASQDRLVGQIPEPAVEIDRARLAESGFTPVRIQYATPADRFRPDAWSTDYPGADMGLADIVGRTTGLVTNPPRVLELTDPALSDFPFVYLVEGGQMSLTGAEVEALRGYLLGGGFLMVDDFWGSQEWNALEAEMGRVFPDREAIELDLDHEIFRSPYVVETKPQLANISGAISGITWERDGYEADYRGYFDDAGRLMALLCHNTDFGDAWEHMQTPEYPLDMIVGQAIPMTSNIVLYAISH